MDPNTFESCHLYFSLAKQLMFELEEVSTSSTNAPPLAHLATIELFDSDVQNCLSQSTCTSVDVIDLLWKQVQLSSS